MDAIDNRTNIDIKQLPIIRVYSVQLKEFTKLFISIVPPYKLLVSDYNANKIKSFQSDIIVREQNHSQQQRALK